MARTHARIFTSIWQDPDFVALSPAAQRLFVLILSQPKLTNVGVIDYRPSKWARMADGTTAEDIEDALDELERGLFVVIDYDTEELLVRTFVKNDGMCDRWQMVSSMWSAWELIESRMLRRYVLDWLPDKAWTTERAAPPMEAESLRHSEPIGNAIGNGLEPDSHPIETPNSLLLSPTPTPAPSTEQHPRFNEFWEVYPLRKAKGAALKAWAKALKQATADEIIAGAARYRDDPQRKPDFTAHAASWLNAARWEDEYATAAANGVVFTGGRDA